MARCYGPVIGIPSRDSCCAIGESCGVVPVGHVKPASLTFGYAVSVPPLADCEPASGAMFECVEDGVIEAPPEN